jgi:hypothetical protein
MNNAGESNGARESVWNRIYGKKQQLIAQGHEPGASGRERTMGLESLEGSLEEGRETQRACGVPEPICWSSPDDACLHSGLPFQLSFMAHRQLFYFFGGGLLSSPSPY